MVGVKRKTAQKIQNKGRFGSLKSRSKKAVFKKTPGSRTVVHYKKKKISKAKCASCGKVLPGTMAKAASKIKNAFTTKKKPTRPFGGNLCSACMRKNLIRRARK